MHLPLPHEDFASLWPTLGDAAVKGAMLMTFATVAAIALSKGPAARRHLLWVLALSGTLAIPALSALPPHWRIHLPDRVEASAEHASVAQNHQLTRSGLKLGTIAQPAASANSPTAAGTDAGSNSGRENPLVSTLSAHLPSTIVEIWVLGMAFFFGAMLLGAISVWRLGRRAEVVVDENWLDLLEACSRLVGLRQTVTLLRSDQRVMPMTWGIVSPKVLIPAGADEWSVQRRCVVLTHELAHIQRRDCMAQFIGQLTRAIHWFNPLCWWANRRLTVERELACDDMVLSRGTLASDYAEQLLAVAGGARPGWGFPVAAVAMARPSRLGERLISILDPQRNHKMITKLEKTVLITVMALVMAPMAVLSSYGAGEAQVTKIGGGGAAVMAADLPPIDADAQLLVRIDMQKCSPEQLKTAARAVLGDQSAVLDESIASSQETRDALVKHGANVLWIAAKIVPSPSAPIGYVPLPANDDGAALAGELKKTMNNAEIVKSGNLLVIRETAGQAGLTPRAPGRPGGGLERAAPAADADRLKAFAVALGMAGNDSAFALAVVPNPPMRVIDDKDKDAPFPIVVLQQILRESDSLTLSANLSSTPSVSLKINCADDTRTKFVSSLIDQELAAVATLLLPRKQFLAQGSSPESLQQSKDIGGLVDQLQATKSTVNKNVVELALDDKTLATMGKGLGPILIDARRTASDVVSMNHMKQLILGIIMYADAHKGAWPDKLDDIKDSVGGAEGLKQIMANPVTGEATGYVFEKPQDTLSTLKKPSETVILYELKDGKKQESGCLGYADGHVQRKQ